MGSEEQRSSRGGSGQPPRTEQAIGDHKILNLCNLLIYSQQFLACESAPPTSRSRRRFLEEGFLHWSGMCRRRAAALHLLRRSWCTRLSWSLGGMSLRLVCPCWPADGGDGARA